MRGFWSLPTYVVIISLKLVDHSIWSPAVCQDEEECDFPASSHLVAITRVSRTRLRLRSCKSPAKAMGLHSYLVCWRGCQHEHPVAGIQRTPSRARQRC